MKLLLALAIVGIALAAAPAAAAPQIEVGGMGMVPHCSVGTTDVGAAPGIPAPTTHCTFMMED